MTEETKLRLCNITSKAALELGSESWILKQRIRQRLGSAPMKFLGALLGLTTLDETQKLEQDQTKKYSRKNWRISKWLARHVDRMRSTRVPQQQALTDRKERSGEPENKMEGPISSSKTGTGLLAETWGGSGWGGGGGRWEGEDEEDRWRVCRVFSSFGRSVKAFCPYIAFPYSSCP